MFIELAVFYAPYQKRIVSLVSGADYSELFQYNKQCDQD